jgi:hypothetical protein
MGQVAVDVPGAAGHWWHAKGASYIIRISHSNLKSAKLRVEFWMATVIDRWQRPTQDRRISWYKTCFQLARK